MFLSGKENYVPNHQAFAVRSGSGSGSGRLRLRHS